MEQTGTSTEFRKWQRELRLAEERQKDWLKTSKELWRTYRAESKRANSFNLLWANTETLRPNLYNTTPKPDVRRRFRDTDVLGKAVSEVLTRALSYSVDGYDYDACMRFDVLDSLIDGQGISRVRYVPSIVQVGPVGEGDEELEKSHEAYEGNTEELEYEQVICEHVNWQDFLHGYGRTWPEVEWVAFRHQMQKADVRKMFGDEIAAAIKYDQPRDEQSKDKAEELPNSENYLTAKFWEVWDKEEKRVFFVQDGYRQGLIYPLDNPQGEPPIAFKCFFPIPEPLKMVEDSGSLLPVPPYELYRQQAQEVDKISARINKLVSAMKVRGAYDATMKELANLMTGDDNDLLPVASAQKWMQGGGLEKAIWWMPIEQAAKVIAGLYQAREEAKRAVYELSGVSDVMRGDTKAEETYGAQQLKANFGSMRLKRMQKEVKRYARDLIRLMAEVVGEKFTIPTLQKMTGLNFPDAAKKMQAQMQMMQLQQAQQPIPEQLQALMTMPTWEDIKAVMADDMSREYRVDVETDSTVMDSVQQDMGALKEVLTGIVEFINGIAPAVQAGAFPIEAVKAICQVVARRSMMGDEIEDALDKIQKPQAPAQAPDPKVMEKQIREQVENELQAANVPKEIDHIKREADLTVREVELKAEREKALGEIEIARIKSETAHADAKREAEKMIDDMLASVRESLMKLDVEKAGAQKAIAGEESEAAEQQEKRSSEDLRQRVDQMHMQLAQDLKNMIAALSQPRRKMIERGPDGQAIGLIETVGA